LQDLGPSLIETKVQGSGGLAGVSLCGYAWRAFQIRESLMRSFFVVIAAVLLAAGAAMADDRPLTDQEKASLTQAVTAQGCSGSKMKFDDGKFEVDDATCADGKKYELVFDQEFKLIKKEQDD